MPLLKLDSKRSLTRTTLIKMGIRIAIVIIVITLISYWHVISVLKSQTLEQLEKYIVERGQRESNLFILAQDNHAEFQKELLRRLDEQGNRELQSEFDRLFVRWEDGVIRNRPEGFDGTRQAGVYIDKTLTINADVRRRVLTFYDLVMDYGPAWHNRFQDTYVTTPENIMVIYWPEVPTWVQDATADLYMPDEEYLWVADKKHNPSRETSWTGLFYDKVANVWMVSCETPVDIAGRHIATIGHDIILNELLDRTVEDHLEGAYNIIFREDARLIAHPKYMNKIMDAGGEFDILKSDDQHLIKLFQSVINPQTDAVVIDNTENEEYLAVTKINGPDWYFVTVYPKSLLAGLAFDTARFIFILGMISLLIEIIVLFWVLRKQVAQPLREFLGVTRQIAGGHFGLNVTEDLPLNRRDEIGRLAQSFNGMAGKLKNAFDTLEAKNAELQHLDKLKDEFLANTSHELRTPLNGIIGIAESLNDGAAGQLPEKAIANLTLIATSGRRLSNLVNDLLDFSKLRHQKIELQIKPISVREITDIVLAFSQPLIGKKSLQLINAISQNIPLVDADENRLQQIFYNLIGNAIKFTESGQIEVSAKLVNDNVNITIADTGIGISAEKLDRIFESFEQANGGTAREYGGTGLGLAVTKQLVELHNGEIRVESIVGEGSRFTFTLPVSQNQTATTSQVSPIKVLTPELTDETPIVTADSGEFKILIVDDEPVNLQVLNNYLSLQNYHIVQASSGTEALAFIEDGFKPDAILLDVMMPRMTGYEVTQKIREKWQADEVPILLLTAKNQIADLVTGLKVGANDYLTKPISKDELLARIKTHLQIKELQAEALRSAKENEARLRQFLEAMPVGIKVLDASGKSYFINQRAQQILGKESALADVLYQAGTHQAYPSEKWPLVRALQGESSSIDDVEVWQNNETLPLEVWGTPIFDDNKQVNYAIIAFADITERLKREQAEREREAAEAVNKMMTESIQYAKIIQSSLLPNFEQVKTYLPNSFFLWMPRDIVGGDMIYAQSVEDGLIIAIVDCTGHGVPGAFMTMVASTHMRRIIRDEGCYEPSDILKRLNFLVKTSLQQDSAHARSDDGLDAAICWIKPDKKTLNFAGAKLPLYYIHNDGLNVIAGDRQSLGYKRSNLDFEFSTHTVSIEPGMSFYMSTDGFLDQLGGPKRFPFGNKRFRQLLMENRHDAFEEQSAKMVRAFNEYKGEHDRQDDVTVVGFNL
jgi:PAS domain S-box-containing protein